MIAETTQEVSAPARPIAPLEGAVWITWENQRRNAGIADALGVPLFVFDYRGSRARRYVLAAWRTLRVLFERRPRLIFVQNPSVVLAFIAVTVQRWFGANVAVDAHNAAIIQLSSANRPLRWAARYIVRRARWTLISNASLAGAVTAAGGRPFVLPDRIPDLPSVEPRPSPPGRVVLFICSFASDEPFLEVIEAARSIDPSIRVYITGNPRERAQHLRAIAPPNVTFTGFLPEHDYVALLNAADVVIDLTTREDCLVCGAYESVAAGRPMILSDTAAIRRYFSAGVRYTNNSREDLAMAITEVLSRAEEMQVELEALKTRLGDDWNRSARTLVDLAVAASRN